MRKKLLGIACIAVLVAIWGGGCSVASADVAIDATNFPDDGFRKYISRNFDKDSNGILSDTEIANATSINVAFNFVSSPSQISSLQGVEYFVALTELNCRSNQLTFLDVSHNTALTVLYCESNKLTSLDVSKNTVLKTLGCSYNGLTELDVSKNTALTWLDCGHNSLTALNVSKNTALTALCCSNNRLTSLDVSKNTALTELDCSHNSLTVLNVSKNTALKKLTCGSNYSLTTLDVSKNTALEGLYCDDVGLTTLDVSKNTALTKLDCSSNQLVSLDVSKNAALEGLTCDYNNLTVLDVSKNTALLSLFCSDNSLTRLDVSNNTALTSLVCYDNDLTELDLSKNVALTTLYCAQNHMTTIDLSSNKALKTVNYNTQIVAPLKITSTGDAAYPYQLDFSHYMSSEKFVNISDVTAYTDTQLIPDISTEYSNGIARFSKYPRRVSYQYDSGYRKIYSTGMYVTIADPVIDVFEIMQKFKDGRIISWPDIRVVFGQPPYTWSYSGTLPDGTTLTQNTKGDEYILSGVPTKAGTFVFTVTVTDANSRTATKEITVIVDESAPAPAPTLTGKFSNGVIKAKYSKSITVSGDSAPYTWVMASGDVPTGLTLTYSDNKAKLSGTPTKSGTFKFTLTVTDKNNKTDTKTFTVKITKPSISGTLSNSTVKAKYTGTLKVSGGTKPYTWALTSGDVPAGLTLIFSDDKAILSGKPTTAGTFTFKLKATDKNKAAVTKSFTVKITKPAISGTLADSTLKASYSKTLKVSGGVSPYKWVKSSGTLPNGLKLTYSDDKAVISGKPTKAGTFTFKIKATDANNAAVTKSFTVKITQPEISGTFANGKLKASYSKYVTVSGGVKAYTWAVLSGDLPTGLKLTYSGTKATISGTPTKSGTFKFSLKVTDANKATATQAFTVKITKPAISGTLANGVLKAKYSKSLKVSGGTASYTWTVSSGELPTGLKLTSSNTKATISGTPTKTGTFTFKIKVTDANKATATQSFTVKITKPAISGTLADGTVKTKYSKTLKVSGGTATYTWTKASGTLPTGLKLTSSNTKATISGTPTAAGTFTFKIKVTDANGAAATKSFTVKIAEASTSSSKANSQSEKTTGKTQSEQTKSPDESQNSQPENSSEVLDGEDTDVSLRAELKVVSDDVVEAYDGKDSDMVKVKAGVPLRFTVGEWGTEVVDVVVYVDDKPVKSVTVSGEGEFTLPVEVVHDDFKVSVKAKSAAEKKLESEELYIIAE